MSPLLNVLYAGLLLCVLGMALIPDAQSAGTWYATPRLMFAGLLVALLVAAQVAFVRDIFSYIRSRGAALQADRSRADGQYSDSH